MGFALDNISRLPLPRLLLPSPAHSLPHFCSSLPVNRWGHVKKAMAFALDSSLCLMPPSPAAPLACFLFAPSLLFLCPSAGRARARQGGAGDGLPMATPSPAAPLT